MEDVLLDTNVFLQHLKDGCLIAATALQHQMPLVTLDKKDFKSIPHLDVRESVRKRT